ncbi:hypothetical protein HUN41_00182 [Streptomyces phage Coruscant]|uniref:DUF732 domain-containing protein n=1 Tax=Streptomyces phage Coruscant TaxID=2739834 RepID=A0A7G4AW89_9CAUD|nr:hypothetical protein PP454_gp138 [Streptomyces phage Coruscant]QMP84279.1 hypothetical protein HUN41_00182 [Streptomyces phage Coruscant]
MKRASLLIGLLLLTGCTIETQGEKLTRDDLIDIAFVSTVKEEVDLWLNFDEIVTMGRKTCETENLFVAMKEVEKNGISEYDASYIVGAAWQAYCPDHADRYR